MVREEFKLPDVGEGVAEGELVRWLVEPGDAVEEDQPVAEVETDKALVEVPSPYDGTVAELLAEEGEVVPVGEVIIAFDVPGEGETDAEPAAGASEESEAEAGAGEVDAEADADAGADADADEEVEAGAEPSAVDTADEGAAADAEAAEKRSGRVFAPPSARRLARELGVELSTVDGSGPGGRITESDVRAAVEAGGEGEGEAETGPESPGPRSVEFSGKPAVSRRASTGNGGTADADAGATEPAAAGTGAAPAGRDRTLATPATRRVAEEEGVDIDDVPAVEERDGQAFVDEAAVREYAAAQRAAQEADAAAVRAGDEAAAGEQGAGGAPEPRSVDLSGAPSAAEPAEAGEGEAAETGAGAGTAEVEGVSDVPARTEPEVSGERVPYRGVRRTIGEAMERSKFTAPHVTHTDTADVSALVDLRAELRAVAAEGDVKLTYTPFVMKACTVALREFPSLNAMLDEEAGEIVHRDDYHIGVATATDVGLMVPVVRDVDRKGLRAIAEETNEVVAAARDRTIAREDLQGSTFTVTNVGVIGGEYATPIINYPEVAILALGAIEERPRVVDGEVVARHTLPLSLSIDHRVIDGATAARFTNRLVELLEEPRRLLIE